MIHRQLTQYEQSAKAWMMDPNIFHGGFHHHDGSFYLFMALST